MSKFVVTIKTDGAAFEEWPDMEVSRILREIAEGLEDGISYRKLFDYNGNVVGSATYTDEQEG